MSECSIDEEPYIVEIKSKLSPLYLCYCPYWFFSLGYYYLPHFHLVELWNRIKMNLDFLSDLNFIPANY